MPHRFLVPQLTDASSVSLAEDEAHHAARVLRLKQGDSVILFDGINHEAQATITSVSKREVVCEIESVAIVDREAPRFIAIAVALPKGDRLRSVIEKSVELGASCLLPLHCSRSVAIPNTNTVSRCERYVIDATKQCERNRLMKIAKPMTLTDLISVTDQELADALGEAPGTPTHSADPRLGSPFERQIAHPGGALLSAPSAEVQGPHLFAIGPEGGFSDEEISAATGSGFTCFGLGPRILRVETAVSAVLSLTALPAE